MNEVNIAKRLTAEQNERKSLFNTHKANGKEKPIITTYLYIEFIRVKQQQQQQKNARKKN